MLARTASPRRLRMAPASALSGLLPFPPLTADEQAAVVAAAYENAIVAAVARLGVHPGSVAATQAAVPEFAAALEQADDWLAMQLVESLRQTAADPEVADRVRIPLAKQLLKMRPPAAWVRARDTARSGATDAGVDAKPSAKQSPAREAAKVEPFATDRPMPPVPAAAPPNASLPNASLPNASKPPLPTPLPPSRRRVHEPVPRLLAESTAGGPSSAWPSAAASASPEPVRDRVDESAAITPATSAAAPSALAPASPRPDPPPDPSPPDPSPPDQSPPDQSTHPPPTRPPRSRRSKKPRGAKLKRSRQSR